MVFKLSRDVVEVEVIFSITHIPHSTKSKQHFAKAGKNKFHITCGQLSVDPGLKMHCYLRVCTPPPIPSHPIPYTHAGDPGRGDQKLTLDWTQTTVCLFCPAMT